MIIGSLVKPLVCVGLAILIIEATNAYYVTTDTDSYSQLIRTILKRAQINLSQIQQTPVATSPSDPEDNKDPGDEMMDATPKKKNVTEMKKFKRRPGNKADNEILKILVKLLDLMGRIEN